VKPGAHLEPADLYDFVARDLASFKLPARIWISPDPLPKLGSGKIDKVMLRKHYREIHADNRVGAA
jgi:acyl-CoA synthetase (AMP-forming)/AMP-acid ligase II